jgi:hypothetical protein
MKLPRLRLSTVMLLIAIIALCIALVVQQQGAARRELELRAEVANHKAELQALRRLYGQQRKAIQDLLIESPARMIDMHKQLYKQRGDDGKK